MRNIRFVQVLGLSACLACGDGQDGSSTDAGAAGDTSTTDQGAIGRDVATGDLGDPDAATDSGVDRERPRVVASTPSEGGEALPTGPMEIQVVFSEAMDASRSQAVATFRGMFGGGSSNLTGTFSSNDTVVTFALEFEPNTTYAVDLSEFRDVAGNRLDGTPCWVTASSISLLTNPEFWVAVGTALSGRPPHRSQRAGLPHWAPTSGEWRRSAFRARDVWRGRAGAIA